MEEDGWTLDGNVFMRGDERCLPLYEAKLFHQYDHRFATFDGVSENDIQNGNARPMTADEKSDPGVVAVPRYWVPEKEVADRLDIGRKHYTFIEHRASSIEHRASSIEHRASSIEHRASSIEHRASSIEHRASSIEHRASSIEHRASSIEHSRVAHRTGSGLALRKITNATNERTGIFSMIPVQGSSDSATTIIVGSSCFRDIARSTDLRTAIFVTVKGTAVSNKAPLLDVDHGSWLQAFRGITNSTNERTVITDNFSTGGAGNSAPVISYERARAVASALVLANMNSIPLDWAARLSVGGVNMNFFIVKQLPVLPPESYLREAGTGHPYVHLVVPRVLELTYTSEEMAGFAADLGFDGPPFHWDDQRRHCPPLRTGCDLRPDVRSRPCRSRMDTGRGSAKLVLSVSQAKRDSGLRRVQDATLRAPGLRFACAGTGA